MLGAVPLVHCAVVISLQVIDEPWACAGSAVSWALPLAALLAQREERERKRRRVLLYLAAPLSLLPLAATTSLVIRHHFFPMVMVILVAADEAEPLLARRWGVAVPGAAAGRTNAELGSAVCPCGRLHPAAGKPDTGGRPNGRGRNS